MSFSCTGKGVCHKCDYEIGGTRFETRAVHKIAHKVEKVMPTGTRDRKKVKP